MVFKQNKSAASLGYNKGKPGNNYCDSRYGAAACVGFGELVIRLGSARQAIGLLQGGMGLEEAAKVPGVVVFHAGTARDERGRVITSGGRVLGVTGYSDGGLSDVQKKVYSACGELYMLDENRRRVEFQKRG